MCNDSQPESTVDENRQLMQGYLLGKRLFD
jgi:hypothetical protein